MNNQKCSHGSSGSQTHSKKWGVYLLILLLIAGSVFAGFFYIYRLQTTFLANVQFYLDEIAFHDKKSVDQEIEKQWERLEVIGNKLALESYQSGLDLQHFLNPEMEAAGFGGLMLLDDKGLAHEANYLIQDVSGHE